MHLKGDMKHIIVVFLVFIATLLLLFYPNEKTESQVFISNSEPLYKEVVSNYIVNEDLVSSPYDSAMNNLSLGDSGFVYNTQAQMFLEHDTNYKFEPHIAQTVVIAIDRDMTDVKIESFADLLKIDENITFDLDDRFDPNDWGTTKAQQVILSMAYALDKSYDIRAVGEFMRYLWDNERFAYQDMWQPIVITYDNVAAEYIKTGRNLEVIIPNDGTITLEYGLLYYGEPPEFAQGLDEALIEAGYRLPDGRADQNLFAVDYSHAQTPIDEESYRCASASLGAIIRRTAFNRDIYNVANIVEYAVMFMIFMFFMVMYIFSIKRRVTDRHVANALIIASITAIVFIVLGLMKYLVENSPVIETILWYSFYIPMFSMSASLVYVMMRAEHTVRPMNIKRAIKWFKWYVYAEIAALVMVFTNHYHNWVFVVTDYMHSYHRYNFGYYIVLGIMYLGILITLFTLISQCVHSPRKKMFMCPVIMVIVMFVYSCGHIFDFELVLNFEISFAISLLAVLFSELCMFSRIFPHNKGYNTLFLHSSLAMQIKDLRGNIIESSIVTQKTDENFVLKQWDIAGGNFLYFEDRSSINNMNKSLEQVNEMRRENNRVLLQKSKLQADLATLAVQRDIYENIDQILLSGTEKIEELSKGIAYNKDRKKAMAKVNILACIMKRACMFRINLLYQQNQQVSIFLSALNELKSYCVSVDISLTVSCRTDKKLTGYQVVSMYSLCSNAVEMAIEQKALSILVQIYEQGESVVISVLGDVPLFSEKKQKELVSSLHKGMACLYIKPWEETQIYLLSDDWGVV